MGTETTAVAMQLDAIATAESGSLLSQLLQPDTDPAPAPLFIDAKIADAGKIPGHRQLWDEMQTNEPAEAILLFRHA